MNLHFGGGEYIPLEQLVCVIDAVHMGEDTRAYLSAAESLGRVRPCRGEPRAYLITRNGGDEVIFASPIAPATLKNRWVGACLHTDILRITRGE